MGLAEISGGAKSATVVITAGVTRKAGVGEIAEVLEPMGLLGISEPTGVLAVFPVIDVRKIRQIKYVAPELSNGESSGHTEQQERRRGKRGLHRLDWSSSRRQRRWGDKKSIRQAAAYLYVGAQSGQDRPSPPGSPRLARPG